MTFVTISKLKGKAQFLRNTSVIIFSFHISQLVIISEHATALLLTSPTWKGKRLEQEQECENIVNRSEFQTCDQLGAY